MSEEFEKQMDVQTLKIFREELKNVKQPRFSLRKVDYGFVPSCKPFFDNRAVSTRFRIIACYHDNELGQLKIVQYEFYSPYVPQHFAKALRAKHLEDVIVDLNDLIQKWESELP